ncbi:OprO/OprP family phosphate-selective porin [Nitrosovibrio sp. Nv4]|uniref:OprO/OprP family phosphate-selective porin n=1 Tax=Nitrosovibrio sp. Nv4 TaxID=1945880 RepID=UPI000BD0D64F|nr:porin [Nitrosovibrio sp. Nv4]SOD40362.1 phosphate-selective porin OprO and OprP [Nitrosovibrio sp. Nv4]
MRLSRLTLAITAVLGSSVSTAAFAIDLYVDTKTEQIYAKPGPGRVHMGSFVKEDAAKPAGNMTDRAGDKAVAKTGDTRADSTADSATEKTDAAEVMALRRDIELKAKMREARLVSDMASLEERVKETEKTKMKYGPGLHFESKDGNFTAAIDGRLQVDSQYNIINDVQSPAAEDRPYELNSGATIRRARLGVEGTFYKKWDYKFEYDFSRGNGAVTSGITDAFIRYNFDNPLSVKVGSFKEPFSLEEATSNRFYTFVERNMAVNTFLDNPNVYKTGVGVNYAVPRWQTGIAFQTEPVGSWSSAATSINPNGNNSRNNGSGDISWASTGRISGRPWLESETKFLHIGASASHTRVNTQYFGNGNFANGGMSFGAFPAVNVDRTNVLNTSNLSTGNKNDPDSRRVESYNRWGAETALVYGPFSAQAEYLQTDIYGHGYSGESLFGYYGYASYFLTGESRTYHVKNGAWNRLKPHQAFQLNGPGWGAWEIAAGYDYLNMNDGVIRGGEADLVKFGLNWYPHSNMRVMTNYVHVLDVNTAGVTDRRSAAFNNANLDAWVTRFAVEF